MNSTDFETEVALDTLDIMDKFGMSEEEAYETAYEVNAERFGIAMENTNYDSNYGSTEDYLEECVTETASELITMYDDMTIEEAMDIAENYVYGN